MEKSFAILCLLSCCAAAAHGRQLRQAPSYATVAEALTAVSSSGQLTILLAAVQAANVSVPENATWTILAPSDAAFTERLAEDLNITPQQLLEPANHETLVKVLSYHVIPSAAVVSSQFNDGDRLTTALAGAAPLEIDVNPNGRVKIRGDTNNADVTVADIKAGGSVVHVIDDVLLPAGIGNAPAASG